MLIDDLVTKGVDEPYRVFTSRAEHRLTLRESNAEERLFDKACSWGLLSEERQMSARIRIEEAARLRKFMASTKVGVDLASELGLNSEIVIGQKRSELLRRPEIRLGQLVEKVEPAFGETCKNQVEEEIKYEGYIKREEQEIERLRELERLSLPHDIDYRGASGLSLEVQEKLEGVRPTTLGQASRIPGVTPAAIALLRLYVHKWAQGAA